MPAPTLRATVDLSRFASVPPVATIHQAREILSPCIDDLRRTLEPAIERDQQLHVGGILSANGRSECTVSIVSGSGVGVAAIFRWDGGRADRVQLTVDVYSKGRMRWVLSALGVGLVVGLCGTMALLPLSLNPRPRFFSGLLGGAAIAGALVVIVVRLKLGIDIPASRKLAEKITPVVESWLTRNAARLENPQNG